ncbi:hypothetical protein [Phytoactinopolyspora mesophila]|uniref:Uncharacterized protein n=1 Tax=Phytoactinopolyspora mesophila TaxID=2650750 RepID=A0A7K3MCJ9_9ACTN|nr:hypothetical protein [Phytoactinopolyspora mesophila]NDL60974.1 hypothetical protein [Phytoactinopolyspora mesophila]
MATPERAGEPRPDVVTAAWSVLATHDELARVRAELRKVRHGDWASFARWRERGYVPAVACWASAVATLVALIGPVRVDPVTLAERLVAADIAASLAAVVSESEPVMSVTDAASL